MYRLNYILIKIQKWGDTMNFSSSVMTGMGISLGNLEVVTDYLYANSDMYEPELTEIKTTISHKPCRPSIKVKPIKPKVSTQSIIKKFSLIPNNTIKNIDNDEVLDATGVSVIQTEDFDFSFDDLKTKKEEREESTMLANDLLNRLNNIQQKSTEEESKYIDLDESEDIIIDESEDIDIGETEDNNLDESEVYDISLDDVKSLDDEEEDDLDIDDIDDIEEEDELGIDDVEEEDELGIDDIEEEDELGIDDIEEEDELGIDDIEFDEEDDIDDIEFDEEDDIDTEEEEDEEEDDEEDDDLDLKKLAEKARKKQLEEEQAKQKKLEEERQKQLEKKIQLEEEEEKEDEFDGLDDYFGDTEEEEDDEEDNDIDIDLDDNFIDLDLDEEDEIGYDIEEDESLAKDNKVIQNNKVAEQIKSTNTQQNNNTQTVQSKGPSEMELKMMEQIKQLEARNQQMEEQLQRLSKVNTQTTASSVVNKDFKEKSKVKDVHKKHIEKVDVTESKPQTDYERYSSMQIDSLFNEVREFMVGLGVEHSTIDISKLVQKFGQLNIKKLIDKSYIIKIGKGVTIGR